MSNIFTGHLYHCSTLPAVTVYCVAIVSDHSGHAVVY